MKWFRLYSSVLNDPKVQRLSPALFKQWINILCVASDYEPRGSLPPMKDLAFALRLKTPRCEQIVRSLCTAGVLDRDSAGTVRVHSWDSRQPKSDNVAERVDAYRRRQEAAPDTLATRNVTLHETLQTRSRIEVDVDTDIEESISPSGEGNLNAAVVAPAAPAAAASNGHNHWTAESAKRTAEEVARKIRLPSSKVADLADYIKACPQLTHELIIGEARSYTDWLNKAHRGAEARVFYNRWLKSANQEREQQRLQQQAPLNGKVHQNGSQQQPPRHATTEPDALYNYHQRQAAEAAATRAKMVS